MASFDEQLGMAFRHRAAPKNLDSVCNILVCSAGEVDSHLLVDEVERFRRRLRLTEEFRLEH